MYLIDIKNAITPTDNNDSRIVRVCAIIKLKELLIKEDAIMLAKHLTNIYDYIEWYKSLNEIHIKESIQFKLSAIKQNKLAKTVINSFKTLLELGEIEIIENRLPLESIRYKLT